MEAHDVWLCASLFRATHSLCSALVAGTPAGCAGSHGPLSHVRLADLRGIRPALSRTVITSLVAYFCSCNSAQLFGSTCLYCGAGCAISIVLPSSVGQVAEFGRCFAAAGSLSSGRQGSSGQRRISTPLPRRSPSRAAGVGVCTLAVLAGDLTTASPTPFRSRGAAAQGCPILVSTCAASQRKPANASYLACGRIEPGDACGADQFYTFFCSAQLCSFL